MMRVSHSDQVVISDMSVAVAPETESCQEGRRSEACGELMFAFLRDAVLSTHIVSVSQIFCQASGCKFICTALIHFFFCLAFTHLTDSSHAVP